MTSWACRGWSTLLLIILLITMAALGAPTAPDQSEFAYDLALRGGTLYLGGLQEIGGTGDLAIRGDRIVAVGQAPGKARHEIVATGLIVAPGFIDLHNHSDEIYRRADWIPLPGSFHDNQNYLTQGVTTIVTGNCGSGFARPEAVVEWLDRIDALPFGTNVIHLIPQGQLRLHVMGGAQADRADPRPGAQEMERMKALLDAGLRAGAWGMSTGLEYDPGARAETNELVELNRVVARHGGIYASHTRHEGPDPERMMASYAEAIAIGERAGTRAHISHIKLSGTATHGMAPRVIDLVEAARARGVRVTADQYPYIATSTSLTMPAPVELRDGSTVLERYCKGEGRKKLRAGVEWFLTHDTPPEGFLVAFYPWKWWIQGKTVADIAEDRNEDPVEVATDLACGWFGAGIYFSLNEADVRTLMQRYWVATASDGSTVNRFFGRFMHPRLYGTVPRKIHRYALREKVITLAQALRSMTELPAEILEIPQRGLLRPGYYADIVAFDPERLRDLATFEDAARYSEGVEYLLVNGVLSIDGGEFTGHRGGRALRHAAAASE